MVTHHGNKKKEQWKLASFLMAVTLSSHLDGPRYRKRHLGSKSEFSAMNNCKYYCEQICHNISQ